MATLVELLTNTDELYHSLLKQMFLHCPKDIMDQIQLIHLSKNRNLISTYQSSSAVYILLQGKLAAIEERVVNIRYSFTELHPIDIVGDYELFTEIEGYYVTLQTKEDSILAKLSSAAYLQWMKQDANALFLRTQMLMKELSTQTQLQRQLLFMDNRTRLLLFLSRMLPANGGILSITRETLASQIGCSVRTCNRMIASLSKEGLLICIHGKVHVDKKQLSKIKQKLEEL